MQIPQVSCSSRKGTSRRPLSHLKLSPTVLARSVSWHGGGKQSLALPLFFKLPTVEAPYHPLLYSFADLCLLSRAGSLFQVIPGKVNRITTCVTVSANLFLVKMTGTWPGISGEVQDVDSLPCCVLPLTLYQWLPSSLSGTWHTSCQTWDIDVLLLCSGFMWFTLHSVAVHHGYLKAENDVNEWSVSLVLTCFFSFLEVVVPAKIPKCITLPLVLPPSG